MSAPAQELPSPARRGQILLSLARASLDGLAAGKRAVQLPRELTALAAEEETWLAGPGATFVTLRMAGALRGCIGTVEARRALRKDVVANSRAAATRDPRFEPLTPGELATVELEVSLLSPLRPLPAADESSALSALRPGIDGVLLTAGEARATFLPQVWKKLSTAERFLGALRTKAGLSGDAWPLGTALFTYQVESWEETR